jgi:hypothetical protein
MNRLFGQVFMAAILAKRVGSVQWLESASYRRPRIARGLSNVRCAPIVLKNSAVEAERDR